MHHAYYEVDGEDYALVISTTKFSFKGGFKMYPHFPLFVHVLENKTRVHWKIVHYKQWRV